MKNNTLYAVMWVCSAAVAIVLMVLMFRQCEAQRDRRAECVRSGKSANDCKVLFPSQGAD